MAGDKFTNPEFELRGFNHLALVARDMKETVAWYEDVLGMKLVKTLELPGGVGQHFFMDMGNGVDGIAFFYFGEHAPEPIKGESIQNKWGVTAIGTMNHLAFDVDPAKFDAYKQKLIDKGIEVTMTINHCDSLDGGHKENYDPATDDGDVFVRSIYFTDPNGTRLEFACWTKTFTDADVKHEGARAKSSAVDA